MSLLVTNCFSCRPTWNLSNKRIKCLIILKSNLCETGSERERERKNIQELLSNSTMFKNKNTTSKMNWEHIEIELIVLLELDLLNLLVRNAASLLAKLYVLNISIFIMMIDDENTMFDRCNPNV